MRKREVIVQRPSRMDILTMLRSESGCKQLQVEIKNYLNDNPWMPIKPLLDALEEDSILIPIFSTIYTQKEGNLLITLLFNVLSFSFRLLVQQLVQSSLRFWNSSSRKRTKYAYFPQWTFHLCTRWLLGTSSSASTRFSSSS